MTFNTFSCISARIHAGAVTEFSKADQPHPIYLPGAPGGPTFVTSDAYTLANLHKQNDIARNMFQAIEYVARIRGHTCVYIKVHEQ